LRVRWNVYTESLPSNGSIRHNIKPSKTPVEALQTLKSQSPSHETQFQTLLPIVATYVKGLVGEKYFTILWALLVWQGIKQTVNPRRTETNKSESNCTKLVYRGLQ
jgi:hypothetical protein